MMEDSLKYIIYIVGIVGLFSSCYKDNEEYLYGADCPTENISYQESIKPIIENQCLACHSTSSAPALGGDISLETYSDLMKKVQDSTLVGAVTQADGFEPMPRSGPKLNECAIDMITIWVNEGALDN